jgi:hypothetical protein
MRLSTSVVTLSTILSFFTPKVYADDQIPWNQLNDAIGNKFKPSEGIIAQIIGKLLPWAIIFGGVIMFIMLVVGGFEMLSNPTNPQSQEQGKNRITYAIIGFVILFVAYWIIQILQIVFGISVVS